MQSSDESSTESATKPSEAQTKNEFLPVQSLDIRDETRLNFNLYVNLPLNQKFVLFKRAGEGIEQTRLSKLAFQNLSQFFIEKKDHRKFISYVADQLKSLLNAPSTGENKSTSICT